MNRGYVKVWRKIEDSGLIQLPNTLALFMHLLLNATYKDRKIGTPTGVVSLQRGQYISGRIELARKLKQTEREIRTSVTRLVDLGIISQKTTNRYSIYTIENYSLYQDTDQQNDQQTTIGRPANDQQTTTKQELNNLNIEEDKPITPLAMLVRDGVPKALASDWLKIRKAKRQPLTETALEATKREAAKAGMTLEDAVRKCCEKTWAGFEASYLQPKPNAPPRQQTIHEKRTATAQAMFGDRENGNRRIIDISPSDYTEGDRPLISSDG